MTPEDLTLIAGIFHDSDLATASKKLSLLNRTERKHLAESIFKLQHKIYGTVLLPSIRATYHQVHNDLLHLFFTQIYQLNERLRSDPKRWKTELQRLRQIELFAETSDLDLLRVAETVKEIELQAHVPFLEQYQEVAGVYLLKDPANVYEFNCKVPVIARSGIFGDDACATGEKDSLITVKPITYCKALFIPRDQFVRLLRSVPGLQEKVFQTVVERAKQGSIRAEEQRKLTQEILENIGQGSFSINVAGEIGENYTSIAAKYLGSDNLAGIPFADLVFRNDRERLRNYYRALHLLFSGAEFNHSIVLDLLPDEVTINHRDFKLHYSFVQDGAGHVMSVFVRMEDITLQRELAKKEEAANAITNKMQSNVGGYMELLEEVTHAYRSIKQFASDYWEKTLQPGSEVVAEMMRLLHGSKGLSGQFELVRLKQVIHEFEEWFLNVDRQGIASHSIAFQELLNAFERELDYAVSFKENLGEGIIKILNGVSFDQEQFAELEKAAVTGNLEIIRRLIFARNLVNASRIVSNWKQDAMRLAEKLQKKVTVAIECDDDLTVPKELARTLNINLGHLYRNSIDHGIELPEDRIKVGKPPSGTISIRITKQQQNLLIRIIDDGRGFDDQRITQLALSNPTLDQNQVKQLINQGEIWRLLFLPGFTSATTVTDVSGRGVGLDAVRQTLTALKGDVHFENKKGIGTEIIITVPLESTATMST